MFVLFLMHLLSIEMIVVHYVGLGNFAFRFGTRSGTRSNLINRFVLALVSDLCLCVCYIPGVSTLNQDDISPLCGTR